MEVLNFLILMKGSYEKLIVEDRVIRVIRFEIIVQMVTKIILSFIVGLKAATTRQTRG